MMEKIDISSDILNYQTHLRQAINIANIGLWTYDPKTQQPIWSDQMYQIFGISNTQEPPDYEQHKKFIHPDDWAKFDDAVTQAVTKGVGYQLKIRLMRPDNSIRWVITKSEAIKDDFGNVIKLIGTIIDITNEQQLEQEIENKELQFKKIFDNALNGILIANDDAEYVYANQAICDMTGYSHDEILSMKLMDITPIPEHMNGKELFQEFIKQGKQTGTYQIKKKDGSMITAEYRAVANIAPGLHVSIIDDITEKIKIDEERNKLDKKLQLAMKSANEGLWEWNLKTNDVFFDNVSLQMLGYSPNELTDPMKKGSWWMEQVHPDDKTEMKTKFNKYINKETKEYSAEFRLKNKDEGYTWISSTGSIIEYDAQRKPVIVIGIHQDITKRKTVENQLQENEIRYRNLFEKMDDAVAVYKAIDDGDDFIIVDFNKKAEVTEKVSREEIIGKKVTEVFPGVETFGFLDVLKHVWATGETQHLPISFYQDDKREGWRKSTAYKLNSGEIVAVYTDVTKRVETVEDLKAAKERLDILFEYAPDGIYINNLAGILLDGNKAAAQMLGYEKDELIGKRFSELNIIKKKHLPRALKNLALNKLGKPTGPDTFDLVRKDGTSVIVEICTYPVKIKNETLVMGIARDISARMESEKKLKQNEERYRTLFNSSNDAIFLIDSDEIVIDCNLKASNMFHFKREDIIGQSLKEFFEKTQPHGTVLHESVRNKIAETFEKGYQSFEWSQQTPDGDMFYADVILDTILLYDSKVVQAVIADKTAVKRNERIESQLASIVTFSDDAIIGKTTEGIITSWNMGAEKMYGYSEEEVLGKYISIIIPNDNRDELDFILSRVNSGKVLSSFETKRKRKDGELIDVSLTISPIKNDNDEIIGISAIGHNITNRKIADKKLRETRDALKEMNKNLEQIVEQRTNQVQRLLEQKDEYIRMIGHDLKNPLGPMLTLLPMVRKKVDDEKVKEMIDVSLNNVYKLKSLLYETLEQAKSGELGLTLHVGQVNLYSVIDGVIESRKQLFDANDFNVTILVEDAFFVQADELRLTEVFDNLISNCIKYAVSGESEIVIDAIVEDDVAKISIQDNGIGISADDLDHVFDQFFHKGESKSKLKSHGLGLSICKKIVEKHGGRIWVESDGIGKGSTFYFTLPLLDKNGEKT